MTRIYTDPQLDFCDVLFQPKRTTLNSRSEADVMREYKFKYYPYIMKSCGIMASNMATTGTIEMDKELSKYGAITCLHKHYEHSILNDYFYSLEQPTFVTVGLKDDKEKFFKLLDWNENINKVCVDIANGYIPKLIDFVKELRNKYPRLLIMAGNVVTGDMTQDLIINGADIVKVGIGPGCFSGDMTVLTSNGKRLIKDIKIGDLVLTHKGHYQEVTNKFVFTEHKNLLKINNIKCTPNHEFYVINKKDRNIVNESNLHKFAYWIRADKLDKDLHLLIKR